MKCPKCGKETSESRLYCGWCGVQIREQTEVQEELIPRQQTSSERWERVLSRRGESASDDRGRGEDVAARGGVAPQGRWKLQLLPILAVIALLLVLTGIILIETTVTEARHATTIGDLADASKKTQDASLFFYVGFAMLAFVVAGISIEYRPL